MAAIDFPASPVDGQVFNAPNGVTYQWNATMTAWVTVPLNVSLFAPLASPAFTGTPTAPTAAPGTNSTQLATTAFVAAAVAAGASIAVGPTPPVSPNPNQLWWNDDGTPLGGQLYIYYNDGNTSQWVPATPNGTVPAGWRVLATLTVPSAQPSIDFTAAMIPSDINHLKFIASNLVPVTNDVGIGIRFFDGTSFSNTGYTSNATMSQSVQVVGNNATVTVENGATFGRMSYNAAGNGVSNAANEGCSIEGTIMNIRALGVRRRTTFSSYYWQGNNNSYDSVVGGFTWSDTTHMIQGVQFLFGTGNIASGSVELWGSP